MNIASTLASYTLGEADILRKAMGKKDPATMAAQRERFVNGAKRNGIELAKANHIFDQMEKFAGYGFNKSHSAAYALIAYQTAYLKAHYPLEYMAALLNSFLNNTDQVVKYINECRERNLELLPPDVNASDKDFTVVAGRIRFGLGAVRNVGEAAIEGIIRSREEHGEFQSFYDFVERVDSQRVNRRVLEQLIKCGAFDTLHPRRACVFAALDAALERAQVAQRDRQSGQVNMFASLRNKKKQGQALALPDVPDWDGRQTLLFEKESLGFYLSGHPLDSYRDQLAALCTIDTQKITERADGSEVVLCGILSITKEVTTKKGERMAFLTLEDKEGTREVVLFPEVFGKARDLLAGDEPRVVMGTVQQDDKGAKILANRILALEEAQVETVEMVHIRLYADRLDADAMARLRHLLVSNPGECRTQLHLFVGEDTEAVIALSSKLTVNPSPTFFEEMDQYFGQGCAAATYKTCMN